MIASDWADQSLRTFTDWSLKSGSMRGSSPRGRTCRSSPARDVNATRVPSGDHSGAMPSGASCVEWRRARSMSQTPVESVSELAASTN